MSYLNFTSQYDNNPALNLDAHNSVAVEGVKAIVDTLQSKNFSTIAFELYPGVNKARFIEQVVRSLNFDHIIDVETALKDEQTIANMLNRFITNDRVFGYMAPFTIDDFYDHQKLDALSSILKQTKGSIAVIGFGATLLSCENTVYVNLSRWEIHKRYRRGMPNFFDNNHGNDVLQKFKRGYFIEWRVADKLKKHIMPQSDFIIDGNDESSLKMVDQTTYNRILDMFSSRPFRLVPYFDPGVWGGQWMKEVCRLDKSSDNYAWAFDGVPEENSIGVLINNIRFEFPAVDVVYFRPRQLLGERVHGRFGTEFPIRFDLLDTMEGGNLSLQVHPLTEYIQDKFGMRYTQDESYYILDAKTDEGAIYLGVKEAIDEKAFIDDLRTASNGNASFPAEKYINKFPVKKHDHISIPAGTIHCSAVNTMVLEISATPYIFTFKLWDWGRLGLDGLPRPIHLEHGLASIQFDRDTEWVKRELINPFRKVSDNETITGLHERQSIETRRVQFDEAVTITTHGSVNMANLVDGEAAVIESIDGSFEPYEIHYAETFIIPAHVSSVMIRPKHPKRSCTIIKAHVR